MNNAVSLAWLMRPRVLILVGVDWGLLRGQYYRSGVKLNDGPLDQERALYAGRNWFDLLMKRGDIWPGLRILSVSETVVCGVKSVSWEEALSA